MKVGSLFSGIGGMEIGLEKEGFEIEWFIEKEKFCQEVLKKNFGNVPIYGEIEGINFRKLKKVDVLAGGVPCQDISNAGTREGLKGKRSGLWRYYIKAIRILRPKYAIIENVSALSIRGLSQILADLAKEGYNAEWCCLRASDFGAWHRRERLFIIAYPNSFGVQGFFPSSDFSKNGQWGKSSQEIMSNWTPIRYDRTEIKSLIESALCRKDDGIFNRAHRIKALGNAIVPQVAQYIARKIRTSQLNGNKEGK